MTRRLVRLALAGALGAALSGCLYETALNASGGGTMSVVLRGTSRKDLDGLKKKMQSADVTVLSAEFQGEAPASTASFTLQFDDITKLSTAEFFRHVSIKRTSGINGAQVLTAVARNQRPGELTDEQVERLGKELRVVTTFPTAVIESNGTVNGNTVTWTWDMREFFRQREVMLTAAYQPNPTVIPEASGAGGTPRPEGTPAPAAAPGTPPASDPRP